MPGEQAEEQLVQLLEFAVAENVAPATQDPQTVLEVRLQIEIK